MRNRVEDTVCAISIIVHIHCAVNIVIFSNIRYYGLIHYTAKMTIYAN